MGKLVKKFSFTQKASNAHISSTQWKSNWNTSCAKFKFIFSTDLLFSLERKKLLIITL